MSLQLHQAGSVQWWDSWTGTMERVCRLEALVCHTRILLQDGYVDRQDEVSSARRLYKEIVGPTQSVEWSEITKRCQRGWCFRNKKSEKTTILHMTDLFTSYTAYISGV